ncbi:hypothetical protein LY90DRAFT_34624 [Neocallimastix californiae]|uniref:Uncharacterized protein n=1 Tax=Neocallimastix californiae TaxID=1754190 RepID=A0A1Y2C2Q6_9FUNG|nr:hypothetical protein LY90DRAFT_34624 [Neocallimastix californiae]|eukprot:ORY41167.1 hypothetical protein LY90DRAFT_34624 [Neocallimastix californiae]
METESKENIPLPEEISTEEISTDKLNIDDILNSINEKLSLDDNIKQNISNIFSEKPELVNFLQIIDQQLIDKTEDEKLVEELKLHYEELKSQKVELEINFEQKSHNFEKRNEELLIEAKKYKDLVETTKKEYAEKDEKFEELKQKFSDVQTKLIKSKQDMINIKANNDRTEAEKKDLLSEIDKNQRKSKILMVKMKNY